MKPVVLNFSYAACHYAECFVQCIFIPNFSYAECHYAQGFVKCIFILNGVTLCVVILRVLFNILLC